MRKKQGLIIIGIITFVFLVILYVANAIFIRNYAKEIDQKTIELELLINENKELRTAYEALIARDRIVSIATTQLGMEFPTKSPEILLIRKDKVKRLEEN